MGTTKHKHSLSFRLRHSLIGFIKTRATVMTILLRLHLKRI
jgi:hypothetical protein